MASADVLKKLHDALHAIDKEGEGAIARLEPLYDENVFFQDPIQTLTGLPAFVEMNRRLMRRAKSLRFEVHDSAAEGENLFLTWKMHLQPKAGPMLTFEGTTHARVRGGKIVYHRDYWDLLGSVADAMPFVAPLYRTLIAKLG
jgi:limonene-1,2-epoxide hydrolase